MKNEQLEMEIRETKREYRLNGKVRNTRNNFLYRDIYWMVSSILQLPSSKSPRFLRVQGIFRVGAYCVYAQEKPISISFSSLPNPIALVIHDLFWESGIQGLIYAHQ